MRKSEVRKWPEMDRQQKIQYLKDYYLLTAVGVILLIAVAVSLIWHVARPRTENLLYAAVIDEFLDEKKLAQVTADMSNLLGADGKRKTVQIDVVILDPPAFTKSRNSVKNAVKGYREINLRGMKLVKDGGYLATCSCSHFMTPELFAKTIREAAGNVHKRLRQVEYRTQAADHPILWGDSESSYLKFFIFLVCDEK